MKRLVIAGLIVAGASGAAMAHGAATWIMANPLTKHCCGPTDCHMEMSNDVQPDGTGWRIVSTGQHFERGHPEIYSSIDSHYWTCRKYPDPMPAGNLWIKVGKKQVACLFVPTQS